MTSKFTKQKAKAKWKSYNPYEVADSLTDSKLIASDISDARRYAYRAKATVVGNSRVKPYEPIYLDGLPNGMSGYWTVLSVKHIFGSELARYMLEVELGTDVLGITDPNAYKQQQYRDVNGELSKQAIKSSDSKLMDYSLSVNANSLTQPPIASPSIKPPVTALSGDPTSPDLYQTAAPDFSSISRTQSWVATSPRTVL